MVTERHGAKAVRYSKLAAQQAEAQFAWDEAMKHYEDCLSLVGEAEHRLGEDEAALLTTLGTGTMDAARTAGTTAGHVFSTVKEKTLGVSSPPAPPPRVVSRAATYFPQEAASQGVRYGKVRARLDIDAAGDVTHVTILSADPAGYFESEATRSLKRWKFDGGADGRTYETDLDFRR